MSLIEFPPAIAYARLYFQTSAGDIVAMSTATGQKAWRFREHRCSAASPAVGPGGGGTVYAVFLQRGRCSSGGRVDGEVVAIGTGVPRVRWRRLIGASETSPLLADGHVFVGDRDGRVWALAPRSGRVTWVFRAGGAVKGGLALSGSRLFVGAYDGHVYALDATSGRQLWRASAQPRLGHRGAFYSTPSAAYGRVYIGSTDGKVYSFGAASGKLRWSHSTGGYVYGSPAIWNGLILVGSYDGQFYAFDAATGDIHWRFAARGPISGSANVIGGVVYFATLSGHTYGLDARDGRLRWSFNAGRYSAPVGDGRKLYAIGDGSLFAFIAAARTHR